MTIQPEDESIMSNQNAPEYRAAWKTTCRGIPEHGSHGSPTTLLLAQAWCKQSDQTGIRHWVEQLVDGQWIPMREQPQPRTMTYTDITAAFDASLQTTGLDFGTDGDPGRYHAEVVLNGDTRMVEIRDRTEDTFVVVTRDGRRSIAVGSLDKGSAPAGRRSDMFSAADILLAACVAAEA